MSPSAFTSVAAAAAQEVRVARNHPTTCPPPPPGRRIQPVKRGAAASTVSLCYSSPPPPPPPPTHTHLSVFPFPSLSSLKRTHQGSTTSQRANRVQKQESSQDCAFCCHLPPLLLLPIHPPVCVPLLIMLSVKVYGEK